MPPRFQPVGNDNTGAVLTRRSAAKVGPLRGRQTAPARLVCVAPRTSAIGRRHPVRRPAASCWLPTVMDVRSRSRKRQCPTTTIERPIACKRSSSSLGRLCPYAPLYSSAAFAVMLPGTAWLLCRPFTSACPGLIRHAEFISSLVSFVETQFDASVQIVTVGLVYYEILHQASASLRARCSPRSAGRRLLAALMISSKWVDDDCLDNRDWGDHFRIPLPVLNALERNVLDQLQFDASVHTNDYELAQRRLVPFLVGNILETCTSH